MRLIDPMVVTFKSPGRRSRRFVLSAALGRKVEQLAASGAREKTISAARVLPELADGRLRPAAVLRGARQREGLTQVRLAKRLRIRQHHLSEMENGKRSIGKAMARKLAGIMRCDYRLFL